MMGVFVAPGVSSNNSGSGAGGAGGSNPAGTYLTDGATSSDAENIRANRTNDAPTIGSTTVGNVNLQSESIASHGIQDSTDYAGILSGQNNIVGADHGVVCGGEDNDITGSSPHSVICGGDTNTIDACDSGTIGGGDSNAIGPVSGTTNHPTIGGGLNNAIYHGAYATIGGGRDNEISLSSAGSPNAQYATISGGRANKVSRGTAATVCGGDDNVVGATTDSSYAAILGGAGSGIDGADYAACAGRRAQVSDAGAFVWSDSAAQDEVSQGIDSFFVKAGGGFFFRETDGFAGEEIAQHQGHVSTSDGANVDTAIGTLSTDQHMLMTECYAMGVRSTGNNSRTQRILLPWIRTGGVVSSTGTLRNHQVNTGTGGTCAVSLVVSSDVVSLRVAGNVGEDWEWPLAWTLQEGGFTT